MQRTRALGLIALAALLAAGCSGNNNNSDGGTMTLPDGAVVPTTDGGQTLPPGAGTCAMPVDLNTAATAMGNAMVYEVNPAGMPNNLHPYGGCTAADGHEVVFRWRVPAGNHAFRISTEGSGYDTALYVRENCSQAMGGTDTACNNDTYEGPQSTLYITNALEGQVLFIVADTNTGEGAMGAEGMLRLTITDVPFGVMSNPCRPMVDGSTAPRCDGALACSEGGAPDGTAICVPTVATGMTCDARGYTNTCAMGARCVTDPSPPEGSMEMPTCAMPGTRAGTACRENEPRCDGQLVCGSGENPLCVRQLMMGNECDPMGASNRCGSGLMCRPVGDAGMATCQP